MSHNPPLSLEEQIAALDPKIKEAEEEIKGLSRQLAGILEQLDGELISDARRAELIRRESHLRAKELLLLTKEQQLRDEKKDLRARLPAPQQQGAEPPSFFSKEKLGLRKIFSAVAGAANFICMLLEPILCKLNLPRSDFFRHLCRYSGWL